jgi:SAM-dependent methyltransferase
MLARLISDEELNALYPNDFYSYTPPPPASRWVQRAAKMLYNRHHFKPVFKRLLEIGGGRGDFIASMHAQSRAVVLEHSEAAREAAKPLGVQVVVGDVGDKTLFPAQRFDYAYLSHSFEHLPEPNAALESIHYWLEPGGRLFIAVPNSAGIVARYFGPSWYGLTTPLHVALYTPKGMRTMLARHGFDVERIAFNSDPLSIPLSAAIRSGRDIYGMSRSDFRVAQLVSIVAAPLSKAFDLFGWGDCMEVHAVKRKV